MPGLLWKDLPKVIEDTPEDKAFYDKLYSQPRIIKVGGRPAPIDEIRESDRQNLAATDPTATFDTPPEGFEPFQPKGAAPEGYEHFTPKAAAPEGYEHFTPKSSVPDGMIPFKTEPGVMDRVKGSVAQIGDILSQGANLLPAGIAGLNEMVKGRSPKEAADEAKQILHDATFSQRIRDAGGDPGPTNPALDFAFDKGGEFAKNIWDQGMGYKQNSAMKRHNVPVNERNEMVDYFANALAQTATGGESILGKRPDYIEGKFSRVPDNALPPPSGATGIVDALKEQQQSEAAANQKVLDNYNQDPTKYGVHQEPKYGIYEPGEAPPPSARKGPEPMPPNMRQDVVDSKSFNPYFRGGALLDDPAMTHDPSSGYMVLNDAFGLQDRVDPFHQKMQAKAAQEQELAQRFSNMSGEEIESEIDNIKKHNDQVELDAVRKYHPDKEVSYSSLTSRRAKDRWLDDHISDEAQDYMNEHMKPESFAESFRGAAGNFDESSPAAMGRSIGVLLKDVDTKNFWNTPSGVTVKAAFRYAKEQGWNLDDVVDAMRSRVTQWAGNDAPELFNRLFASAQTQQEPPKPFGQLDAPEARKPPTSQELQNMRDLGNQVIQKIQGVGLSTGQVYRQFWDTTYKELPAEVQHRFDILKQKAESRTGLTGMSDNPADLTGMARWYVALMHLANNYAWGPKSKGFIENNINAKMILGNDDKIPPPSEVVFHSNSPTPFVDAARYEQLVTREGNGGSTNALLNFIAENSADPYLRLWGSLLHDPTNDIVFTLKDSSEAPRPSVRAMSTTRPGLPSEIVAYHNPNDLDRTSIAPSTIIHEAFHSRTKTLLEMGRDSEMRKKYPDLARLYDEYSNLMIAVMQALPEGYKKIYDSALLGGRLERQGSLGHEFGAYATGLKSWMDVLRDVQVSRDGKTAIFDMAMHTLRVLGAEHDALKNIPEKDRGPLYEKMAKRMELQDSINNDSAFNQLIDLFKPILEAYKGVKFDALDEQKIFDFKIGWLDLNKVYEPIVEPKSVKDLAPEPTPTPTSEMIKKDLPNPSVTHKMVSPYTRLEDITRTFTLSDYKRYPDNNVLSANWYPTTVAKNIIGNPLGTFGAMRIREINGATHVIQRFLYDSIGLFNKAPEAQKNRIVTALNQINRPENQDMLASTRVQKSKEGPGWWRNPDNLRISPEEAVHFGMKLEDYQVYKTTLQPLFETLLKIDKAMLQKGFNRTYDSTVIGYFPRSFGFGSFVVKGFVITPNGEKELKAYRRLPNFIEQRQWMKAWEDQGLQIEKEQAKDFSNFVDHLLAMIELDPNSNIAKRSEDLMQKMEEHKRSQEFERSSRGVVGYIGTQMKDPNELKMLNYMVYHRIKMTSDLYKAARLMNEIARPIRANPILSRMWPNATANIMDIIRRDLGGDISKLKAIDSSLVQAGLSTVYKAYLYTKPSTRKLLTTVDPTIPKSRRRGVKQPKDYVKEQILTPDAHRIFAKQAAAFGSSYVLIGNVPNMITNLGSVPFVSLLGGAVDSFILADSMEQKMKGVFYALQAHGLALKDLAEYTINKVSDPQVKHFMAEVERRGYLVPAQYDDVKQLRDDITKSKSVQLTAKVLSTPKHVFNDPIEALTNIMTFLYYNRLIRLMHPSRTFSRTDWEKNRGDMSANSHMKLVLEFVKNYTGDYAPYNRALMFDKAGDFGRLANNFTIWAGTRQGQLHFLAKNLGDGATEALIALFAAQIVIAGIEGMPFMSDYENFRNAIHRLGDGKYDLPPVDKLLKDMKVPYAMRKGLIMNAFGYDMASRAKWSGWFDMSGVTYSLPVKIHDMGKFAYKYIYEYLGAKGGPTLKDKANFVNALPTMLHGPAQQALMGSHLRKDGKTTIVNRFGKTMYVQNGTSDKIANGIGFKTNKQSEDMQNAYNKHYEEQNLKEGEAELKDAAVENMVQALDAQARGDTKNAVKYKKIAMANLNEFFRKYQTDYKGFGNRVEEAVIERMETPEEANLRELGKTKKNPMKVRIIQGIIQDAKSFSPK
jgi:hypothetical protein